jgi:Leucine-rich repeat (LRR) protein
VNVSELCELKNLTTLRLSNNPYLDFKNFNLSCWSRLQQLLTWFFWTWFKNELNFLCVVKFPELPALEYLFIGENLLSTMNVVKLTVKFINLKSVYLSTNLWNCANLEKIERNLMNFNISIIFLQKQRCTNHTFLKRQKFQNTRNANNFRMKFC